MSANVPWNGLSFYGSFRPDVTQPLHFSGQDFSGPCFRPLIPPFFGGKFKQRSVAHWSPSQGHLGQGRGPRVLEPGFVGGAEKATPTLQGQSSPTSLPVRWSEPLPLLRPSGHDLTLGGRAGVIWVSYGALNHDQSHGVTVPSGRGFAVGVARDLSLSDQNTSFHHQLKIRAPWT